MAEYLNSAKVKVYPSGYRSAKIDLEASRTTEGSVIKALKAPIYSINDNYCFVKQEDDNSITLVLDGYVFNIKDAFTELPSLFSDNTITQIYAYLNVANIATMVDGTSASMRMLVNESGETSVDDETSGKFEGIGFTSTQPSTSTHPIQILVLERGQFAGGGYSSWRIPFKSRLNITTSQIANYDNKPISQYLDVEREFSIGNLLIKGNYSDAPYDEGTTISTFRFGTSEDKENNKFTVDASNDSYIKFYLSSSSVTLDANKLTFSGSSENYIDLGGGKLYTKKSEYTPSYTTIDFIGTSTKAKDSQNVTDNINGKAITSIFESDGVTVKKATGDESGNRIKTNYGGSLTKGDANNKIKLLAKDGTTSLGEVTITKGDIGLGNVDNTSDATKKANFTGSIASGNTGFVTGGDAYTELNKKVDKTTKVNGHALDGDVTVTKSDVGLGSVVNTGDSDTPVSGGTTKFTTGGAYTELNKKANLVSNPNTTRLLTVDSYGQPIVSDISFVGSSVYQANYLSTPLNQQKVAVFEDGVDKVRMNITGLLSIGCTYLASARITRSSGGSSSFVTNVVLGTFVATVYDNCAIDFPEVRTRFFSTSGSYLYDYLDFQVDIDTDEYLDTYLRINRHPEGNHIEILFDRIR